MRSLKLAADVSQRIAMGMMQTNHIDNLVLAANTPKVYTIPTGAEDVCMAGTALYYSRFGAAAAIPSTDVLDGSGSGILPEFRKIPDGVTTIGFVSPVSCIISIEVYGEV